MSKLFSPLKFGPLTLDNRIIIAPMCQYSADEGRATDWHAMHLGNLALSSAGLLIIEATAVDARGRSTYGDLGLWNEETESALRGVLASVRKHSKIPIGIQLNHAGRKASTTLQWDGGTAIAPDAPNGWKTVSASSIAFRDGDPVPDEASFDDIKGFIKSFQSAAVRADRLGIDVIEVHGAHGYLLHQFLSPLSNKRNDKYGGSVENRMRLLLDVFDAVREVVPKNKPVGVRISATDWVEGGWDLEQSLLLSRELENRGCDFLHVSTAGVSIEQKIPVGPNYQVPFAEAIKRQVTIPVIAVGLITEPSQAEEILANNQADAVALARGVLYDPRWPWHAAAELGASVTAPPQYLRSEPRSAKGLFTPLQR